MGVSRLSVSCRSGSSHSLSQVRTHFLSYLFHSPTDERSETHGTSSWSGNRSRLRLPFLGLYLMKLRVEKEELSRRISVKGLV